MIVAGHDITKAIVRGTTTVLRATCSCGRFKSDVPRLSQPSRRKQDRLIREHLDAVGATEQAVAS